MKAIIKSTEQKIFISADYLFNVVIQLCDFMLQSLRNLKEELNIDQTNFLLLGI
jgi:hypothetical protein